MNVSLANMVYSDNKLRDASTLDFSCDTGYIVSGESVSHGHETPSTIVMSQVRSRRHVRVDIGYQTMWSLARVSVSVECLYICYGRYEMD